MSSGFKKRSKEDKLNPCDVKDAVFYHKYTLEEIICFWPKFIDHYHLCSNSSYVYNEPGKTCDYRNNWYRNQSALSEPKLDINQTNFRKCGPSNENTKCSIGKPVNPLFIHVHKIVQTQNRGYRADRAHTAEFQMVLVVQRKVTVARRSIIVTVRKDKIVFVQKN